MERTNTTTEHVFSHLGQAPFEVENVQKKYGSCDHCGTGILWQFIIVDANGKTFKVGSTCVEKTGDIGLVQNVKLAKKNFKAAAERVVRRRITHKKIRETLAQFPGLNAVLKVDHHISRDLRSKLIHFGSLSEAQVELAHKLVAQVEEQKKADANKTAAPEGRQTVQGTILSTRYEEGFYGSTFKMLVQVDTEQGTWRAWGTCPTSLEELCLGKKLKGMTIELTATFTRSDKDESFAFFKRPKAKEVV